MVKAKTLQQKNTMPNSLIKETKLSEKMWQPQRLMVRFKARFSGNSRKDYFVGDVVQIENEFGIKGTTRIVECAISDDNQDGYQLVPTFESDEDENKKIMK